MNAGPRAPTPDPARPARSGEAGFGAIEMAVVLIILGLMIVVTLPGLRGYRATSAMQTAARQFESDLRAAQEAAVGRSVQIDVALSVSGGAVTGYTVKQSATTLWQVTLSSAVHATSTWPSNTISFTAFGSVIRSGSGTLPALCIDNTQGLTTSVFLTIATGRASMTSGTGSC